jgi:hypothetical protein
VELQNPSGQGIDLIAIHPNKDLIVYVEVKTTVGDRPPELSQAQENTEEFVKSRLDRVIAHEGLYKKVSPQLIEIATMLSDAIKEGRPIGGIHISVKGLSKGLTGIKLNVSHWKSRIPSAKALKQKKPTPKPH